jgi:hypothetical protein
VQACEPIRQKFSDAMAIRMMDLTTGQVLQKYHVPSGSTLSLTVYESCLFLPSLVVSSTIRVSLGRSRHGTVRLQTRACSHYRNASMR